MMYAVRFQELSTASPHKKSHKLIKNWPVIKIGLLPITPMYESTKIAEIALLRPMMNVP